MTSMEKRKYPRYEARFSIKYRESNDPDAEWLTGQVKNISLGGMLFRTHKKLSVSTGLVFKLQAFLKDTSMGVELVEIHAKVLDVVESTIDYDTRVIFIELDEASKSIFRQFLDCLK